MTKKSNRSTAFKSASVRPLPFRDTVEQIIATGTTAAVFQNNDLLPSLNRRVIVYDYFVVEVLPGLDFNEEFNCQVQYTDQKETNNFNDVVADAPFKMLSTLNPTQLGFNVTKMKGLIPAIAYPSDCDDTTTNRLTVQLDGAPSTGSLKVRVTSYCKVIPQLSI